MKPLQIGITGGIGSGKSVVCRVLSNLGIPTYFADEESKKLLQHDPAVKAEVTKIFGPEVYQNNNVNRELIAKIVFNDGDRLQQLNNILHPAVRTNYLEWVTRNSGLEMVAKEAAIMFESGAFKDMDVIIVVTAPENLRISRVVARNGKSADEVLQIIKKQLPQEEVVKRSDYEIVNDDHSLVIPQVLTVLNQIRATRLTSSRI